MPKDNRICLIVQNVRSLFNVGAMFRCADVFGIDKIYLCGYTGFPPRDQIKKTALGAEEWIPWERKRQTPTLLKKLKKQGWQIIALETCLTARQAGKKVKPLPKFKPKFPVALVVGNEIKGISKNVIELADEVVEIPMQGKTDSLNVAIASGITMYQLRR